MENYIFKELVRISRENRYKEFLKCLDVNENLNSRTIEEFILQDHYMVKDSFFSFTRKHRGKRFRACVDMIDGEILTEDSLIKQLIDSSGNFNSVIYNRLVEVYPDRVLSDRDLYQEKVFPLPRGAYIEALKYFRKGTNGLYLAIAKISLGKENQLRFLFETNDSDYKNMTHGFNWKPVNFRKIIKEKKII